MPPATLRDEFPPGTLDVLILRTLDRHGSLHGFEIAEAIETASEQGSVSKKDRSTPLFSACS